MIDYASLFSLYIPLLGFRQSTDNCTPRIHPDLLGSTLTVDSVELGSQYLKPEFVYECIDRFSPVFQQRFDDWDTLTTYQVGDVVTSNGDVYVALASSLGVIPSWDAPEWETDLSSYLRQTYTDALSECASSAIAYSNNEAFEQSLLNNSPIYIQKQISKLVTPSGRFVGHKILVNENQHVKSAIREIGINLTTPQTLDIYVFSSLQDAPVQVTTINHLNANTFEVHEVDIDMRYVHGGAYWVGFFEDDLVDSYKEQEYYQYYKSKEQWHYCPSYIANDQLNGTNRPNVDLHTNHSSNVVPFNISVTEEVDYMPLLNRAKRSLLKVMQYNVAIRIIRDMAGTDNENAKTSLIRLQASEVLNGGFADGMSGMTRISKGLVPIYEEHLKQLKMDMCYMHKPFVTNNFGF